MKVTVSRSLLSDALRKVQGLASGKATVPNLSNVKIEAADKKIKFTTTDLDLSVVSEITCNVIEDGSVTLPAKLLCDAISRAAEGDVSIEVNEADCKAIIKAGSSVFRITGLPAVDFPTLPMVDGDATEFTLPQDVLRTMVRRTAYAMSLDDTRRILKGVHFVFGDGFLTCVATDGRRLALAEYHPDEPYKFEVAFTLPAKTVLEMNRNLGVTGNISFKMCKTQIMATLDNGIVFYSKLLEDLFPNYKQVIPQNNDKLVEIDRAMLIAAIDRVGIFSEAHSMKFDIENGEMKLKSSTETGNGEESVPVKYDGNAIHTTYNHAYILDVLKSIDDDEVKFIFSEDTHPVIIKSSLPGLALVMPLRIN